MGIWDTVAAIGLPKPEVEFKRASLRKDFPEISAKLTIPPIVKQVVHLVALDEERSAFWPTLARATDPTKTVVEEVWFAGTHGDIGGGWPEETPLRLWQVTLEYMLRASHGVPLLQFDRAKNRTEGFQSNALAAGKIHDPEWLNATRLSGTRRRDFAEVLESSGLPTDTRVKVHQSVRGRMDASTDTKEPYRPPCLADTSKFEFYPKPAPVR